MPDTKERLLHLLDHEVFDPTISVKPDRYPPEKRKELADVQKTAQSTKAAYHRYGSARHITEMFEDDLRSPYGAKETRKLRDLGLPTFSDVKDEFMRLAGKGR